MFAATRALGVDPGLVRTGWAIVDSNGRQATVVSHGVIAPPSSAELPARLAAGASELRRVLREHDPRVVALEEVFTAPRHPRSALLMAHMRGVICLVLQEAGLPVVSLTATTVKQRLTGNGHASKKQVQSMVEHVTGSRVDAAMRLDESDAIALALAALNVTGRPAASVRRARGLPEHLLARAWSPRV
ncbi:MAG: crossover junction endodeoxyribonuclease RuvC [Chloroflexi bacterium]|nr:crossover junction endodeoxyribonuclease RuvC [Chloroflexota bacterium]MBV9547341.1 crossover junction endodeoxyribonuclease RuvC [Chloroflexota bacterium]